MSKVLYGSLQNRMEENRMFTDKIRVGTLATEFHYSDRTPYEVVEVDNDKHIFIRKLDAKRIDNWGMSDSQDYEYTSNESNPTTELKLRRNVWVKVTTINIADEDECENDSAKLMMQFHRRCAMTKKQIEKYEQGKDVEVSLGKISISFGFAEKYYDYSF